MPKINLQRRNVPALGEFRQTVILCCTLEKPDDNVSTIVERPGVFKVHARVRPIRGETVLDWKGVHDTPLVPTVEVTLRNPPDVAIDIGHWVYVVEQYRESWLKVRTVEDMGGVRRFVILLCTVETVRDRRSDPAVQTPPPVWERPRDAPAPVDDGF